MTATIEELRTAETLSEQAQATLSALLNTRRSMFESGLAAMQAIRNSLPIDQALAVRLSDIEERYRMLVWEAMEPVVLPAEDFANDAANNLADLQFELEEARHAERLGGPVLLAAE